MLIFIMKAQNTRSDTCVSGPLGVRFKPCDWLVRASKIKFLGTQILKVPKVSIASGILRWKCLICHIIKGVSVIKIKYYNQEKLILIIVTWKCSFRIFVYEKHPLVNIFPETEILHYSLGPSIWNSVHFVYDSLLWNIQVGW